MSINELRITFQHREADHSVVQRTTHRFSGRYAVSVENGGDAFLVCLAGSIDGPQQLEREFWAALLDDILRMRIENETAPLRRLIVEAALRSALREPDIA
ncbi:His-Xaa-Ser system protein HxsD [Tahibacter aquaticus]|uniref:His-Xaa-Ser system protein HxsD n=1 Tax=Tahibacter aquaticus TaxID=520092 RepID=A0A4R6Z5F2_9GAMM|nr:hypothetical protein [Tahibacter aquaticus]TDR46799.1 His-Xaa-Ser system protein HxsD [Tahibacter aquaticus]